MKRSRFEGAEKGKWFAVEGERGIQVRGHRREEEVPRFKGVFRDVLQVKLVEEMNGTEEKKIGQRLHLGDFRKSL